MNDFIVKSGKKMRFGYTTGSCAAAATKAAAVMLLTNMKIENVKLTLPLGTELYLDIEDILIETDCVSCCVVKDAGDDPDVTHGIKVFARVKKTFGKTVIDGGIGVGRVTKSGLPRHIGEAAINPVPMKMIENALNEVAAIYNYKEGFDVQIYIPEGEEIAKKTFNSRLGIIGGISVLGTTGIVEPMSEKALIDTIKLEIDFKKKNDENLLFISPGNYGLQFSKDSLGLNIDLAVKCSNYIGETLDYAVYSQFKKILLVGHIGKLVKLAASVMNTHSKIADCRNEIFATHSALNGASVEIIQKIMQATTTDDIHTILEENNLSKKVYQSIQDKIMYNLNYRLSNKIAIEFIIFSNQNGVLIESENAQKYIQELKEK